MMSLITESNRMLAGLNGYVRAGAVELALACDIRIAGNHVRLSSPEAKWGGFPGAGAPVRLPNIVGTARTLELLCTGREIDATKMERYGLVEFVVPRDRVTLVRVRIARFSLCAVRKAARSPQMRYETARPAR
jgi:enoyl-CoA hydratase/carnithine racemase